MNQAGRVAMNMRVPLLYAPRLGPNYVIAQGPAVYYGMTTTSREAGIRSMMTVTMTDSTVLNRRRVAERYARTVSHVPGVQDVRLIEAWPNLEIAVVLDELDLEHELQCRGHFIDFMRDELDPSVGELSIFAESDGVPDWLGHAERLLA